MAVNSGTAALHLALKVLGIGKGDIVLCPSFTFAASANPIVYCGAVPVFIGSEPRTWNMDPGALREAFEEVRLMPQSVSIAGGLDAVRSPAGFIVQPIVGIVGGDDGLDGLVADPAEVDLIFTLPLSHVINPGNFRLVPRETDGRRNDYWVVDHDDHLIWGLSARVLNDLHRRIGKAV